MELTIEDKLILTWIKLNLSKNHIKQIEEWIPLIRGWNYFTENTIQNGAGPLLYKNLQQISNYILIKLRKSFFAFVSSI